VELAHKELGEDALLINARPSTLETRNLGAYEVVFGVPPKTEAAAESKVSLSNASARAVATENLAQDVAELKREIERLAQTLRAGRLPKNLMAAAPENPELYNLLIENELDASLAAQVAAGTPLEDLFETDSNLEDAEPRAGWSRWWGLPVSGKPLRSRSLPRASGSPRRGPPIFFPPTSIASRRRSRCVRSLRFWESASILSRLLWRWRRR